MRNAKIAALVGALVIVLATGAQAGAVITFKESGSDVIATGSGSINLADLSYHSAGVTQAVVKPDGPFTYVGPYGSVDVYDATLSGPSNFGTGSTTWATSSSGDLFGVAAISNWILVPESYASGSSLSGTATYANASFSSLGLKTGTYTWTWGSGSNADSFTVKVGTAVPLPGAAWMGLGLLAVLGAAKRIRRRRE